MTQTTSLAAAQARIIELEAHLKAARGALGDIFDGEPQWPGKPKKELKWCRNRAKGAYLSTEGEQP
jgi:hypothetical protein